jgi:hypothetical protein
VLSIKKAAKNKFKKHKALHQNHPNYQSQYPSQWKVDLKIEGHFNSGNAKDSEEESQGFLPPIRNNVPPAVSSSSQVTHAQPFLQMEAKLNMYNPQSSTKYQNNPFK